MIVKFSTRAVATVLLCAGLSGCASRPPRAGTSFDLYYEAAELFPLAYECIYEQREKEIERLKDRFGIVKEWLSAREPARVEARDEQMRAVEGNTEPAVCVSASNRRFRERRRIRSVLAELERRMASTADAR